MTSNPVTFVETCIYCGRRADRAESGTIHVNVHRTDELPSQGVHVAMFIAHARCFVDSLPASRRAQFDDWPR